MATKKRKAVVNADAEQLSQVEELVHAGQYRSVSEFVREAVADKLQALDRARVAEQVQQYCVHGLDHEDEDLILAQPLDDAVSAVARGRKKDATR